MGPRSADRGNTLSILRMLMPVLLQWGRDQLIAEIGGGGPHLVAALEASMGPRSADRGNMLCAKVTKRQAECASMGPRSADRGNKLTSGAGEVSRPASMGPRSADRGNACSRPSLRPCSVRFNGAAIS